MKRQLLKNREIILLTVVVAVSILGFLNNSWGQFSDIRGFYGLRYFDGNHAWPFATYTPEGSLSPLNPIEYPVVTGLIIWILTFVVPSGPDSVLFYYYINVAIHSILFAATALVLYRMLDKKNKSLIYLLVLSPAVITSLNRNWDMWVVLPTMLCVSLFAQQRYRSSAILLGLAVATKFYPIVLVAPIFIYLLRSGKMKEFHKFLTLMTVTWLIINLPVMLIDFKGWLYFYELSFTRGLGDGSVFTIGTKFGLGSVWPLWTFWALNLSLFVLYLVLNFKTQHPIPLETNAFLMLVVFTLFGKQYSMQYVLWLTPLAILGIDRLLRTGKVRLILSFSAWQVTELLFHIAYYQNLLTRVMETRGSPLSNPMTDFEYGVYAVIRYVVFLGFLFFYLSNLWKRERQNHTIRSSKMLKR